MITLDAMMKFAKTPNTDATQSSGDQPSYSTGLSVGVAVSSGAGERVSQSSIQIKKEKHVADEKQCKKIADGKKVIDKKVNDNKKSYINPKFVPPKSANKAFSVIGLESANQKSGADSFKDLDASSLLKDLAVVRKNHKRKDTPKAVDKVHTQRVKTKPQTDNTVEKNQKKKIVSKPVLNQSKSVDRSGSNKQKSAKTATVAKVNETNINTHDTPDTLAASLPAAEKVKELKSRKDVIYECIKCHKIFHYLKRLNSHELKDNCSLKVYKCSTCEMKLKMLRV